MKKTNKKNLKPICFALAVPFAFAGIGTLSLNATSAAEYRNDYVEHTYSNSFTNISGEYVEGDNLSGWSKIDSSNRGTGMVIDVGPNFSSRMTSAYHLTSNPGKKGSDDKILMLNSQTSSEKATAKVGYKSASTTLDANSYYRFSIDALTTRNGDDEIYSAYASIYVNGLVDEEGTPVKVAYENMTNTQWQTYYFYIATGNEAQTVTFDLYLGSETSVSGGAVFFDEAYLEKFAETTFFTSAQLQNYNFTDVITNDNSTKFVVDALQNDKALDMSGYNFDFEDQIDNINVFSDAWTPYRNSVNAHASIMPINGIQPSYFKEVTKFEYVGHDLSFNKNTQKANKQALVLYNNSATYSSVTSKAITIKAHEIYKLTLKAKVSEIKSGNFSINIKETDKIYSRYGIKKENYTLASYSKTGFSSNTSNNFNNDYTTIELYIKGHDYYDSEFKIELALGSNDAGSEGCVIIDNLKLYSSDNSSFTSASDKVEFKANSSDASYNGLFNLVENNLEYPLKAQGWTATKEKDNFASGVIYLENEAQYLEKYKDESWKFSYPGSPTGTDQPNNLYMMHNPTAGYQSLKSADVELTSSNEYHVITFDYKTVSTIREKDATFAIEVVDTNGITLFYKTGYNAENWKDGKAKLYFRTKATTPSSVNVIIHFGQEKDKMTGYVYLDNFMYGAATQETYEAATDKTDLTNYFLNLDVKGEIGENLTNSEAYKFAIDKNYSSTNIENASKGGIVSGKANEFGVTTQDETNILVISTASKSKSSLTSVYNFKLEGSKYYRMTFDLKTNLAKPNTDDKHECKYGVSVGLTNYSLASMLKSNEDWTTYTIYFKVNEASSQNFTFTLDCDCDESLGSAFLTHIDFAESTQADFEAASDNDLYNETIFTSTIDAEETPDTPPDNTENENPTQTNNEQLWVIIPSILLGAVLLMAILAVAFKKVKFNKKEKVERANYDKKFDVNHDVILMKAKKERDQEAEEIRSSINALIQEREQLEADHKAQVREQRAKSNGKVSKETEREFKNYANKIARLNEKEIILKEQLESTLSAEHLIVIENRLASEEEKTLREMEKLQAGKIKQKQDQDNQE